MYMSPLYDMIRRDLYNSTAAAFKGSYSDFGLR